METILIHLTRMTQITLLQANKALIEVLDKYFDYVNVFSFNLVIELLENISINKYTINIKKDKQSLYRLIYSLGLVKLEILKTYIEILLKTGFIQPSKSLIDISTLFVKKFDNNLYLYINY